MQNNNTASAPKKRKKSSSPKPQQQAAQPLPQAVKTQRSKQGRGRKKNSEEKVKIIFLGGLNEIGKNNTLFEYKDDILILDSGLAFPDADMPGIDSVIPDFSYIERHADKVRGIVITHGHEDHIGSLPYLLKIVNAPVYATRLTAGLIEGKLKEHRMNDKVKINVISPGDIMKLGSFTVEAIHVNHSIPDSLAYSITCPAGRIVHTGDFKIDSTPIDGGVIDLAKFASLGKEGVLCLLSDSTNAERPGYTASERNVGETLEVLFRNADKKRIIVASFASNIHRIQQIIDSAHKLKRKVALSGRSIENVVAISRDLGYLTVPEGLIIPIDNIKNYPDREIVIITTGSQGEPMSALSRMALSDHRKVTVGKNDFIVISASPIPGNEKAVGNIINELMKLGAEVVYEKSLGIHVSGHACQEEQKLILNLVNPKYFIPVHGEQKHLRKHAAMAESIGIPEKNIIIADIGSVVELSASKAVLKDTVPAGKVFVDGSGVGDVGNMVLRDRKRLSQDGIVIVTCVIDRLTGELMSGVDVQTKGFVYVKEASDIVDRITSTVNDVIRKFVDSDIVDTAAIRSRMRDEVSRMLFNLTKRSPIIITVVLTA